MGWKGSFESLDTYMKGLKDPKKSKFYPEWSGGGLGSKIQSEETQRIQNKKNQINEDIKSIEELQKPISVKVPVYNEHFPLFNKETKIKVGGRDVKPNPPQHRFPIQEHYDERLLNSRKDCERALGTLGYKEESKGVWSLMNKNDGSLGNGKDWGEIIDLNKGTLTQISYSSYPEKGINNDLEISGMAVIRELTDRLIEYRKNNITTNELESAIKNDLSESLDVVLYRQFLITPEKVENTNFVDSVNGQEVRVINQSHTVRIKGKPCVVSLTKVWDNKTDAFISHDLEFKEVV